MMQRLDDKYTPFNLLLNCIANMVTEFSIDFLSE